MSPTQRTLAHYRKLGAVVEVVERWNPHSKTRHDLFGMFDLLVLSDNTIIGVQVTSGSNVAARLVKLRESPLLPVWLGCGGKVLVHGWAKRGPRGKVKRWTLREEVL